MYINWNTTSNRVSILRSSKNFLKIVNENISFLQITFFNYSRFFYREAKGNIDRIISNEGNGPPRGPNFSAPTGAGGSMFEMMVPGHKVGLIIGKAGDTIKQLQEQSGAKIVIIQVIRYTRKFFI